jgi:antitoxin VapB
MQTQRRVTLFTNGRNQAIRIPRDFELPGKEAMIRKDGDRLIIEPLPGPTLLDVLAKLKPLDDSIPEIEDQPPEPVDL